MFLFKLLQNWSNLGKKQLNLFLLWDLEFTKESSCGGGEEK